MAFSSPSRPVPAAATLAPAVAWLQGQQQDAEARCSRLQASADWLSSQMEQSPEAAEAFLVIEREIGAAMARQEAARDAISALAIFQN